jgi:rhodanese-related sulfurtransferase
MTPCAARLGIGSLALVTLALAWGPPTRADDFSMVSVDEVEKLLGAPDVKVFDANTRETFQSGHLPGATFVESKTLASALPHDKSARLVFYCKNPH